MAVAPQGLLTVFIFERAHRVQTSPISGSTTLSMVARILNFCNQDHLLRMAQKVSPIKVNNATVSFFLENTLEVQKGHASYQSVKKQLQEEGLPYALVFSAHLKVMHDDCFPFFDSSEAAWDWLQHTYPTAHWQVMEEEAQSRNHEKSRPRRNCQRGAPTAAVSPLQAHEIMMAALQTVTTKVPGAS
ncbi:hypothetical protein NDU88_002310 [Pleurodeles waltl]|uniref:Uncharacterized protein n=1 Tax=Pleurodeles waltl TaxID=8319 RepID=A0AAV7WP74_PLEWA|nr:hypothetical protein NDU88_002310 [Pleurodeles waltl]